MPRKPRFYLPNVPVHVVQRGHSREPIFFETQDYVTYLYWIKDSAAKYDIAVHAFVLMTNHVHLLLTPKETTSISLFMQYIGRRYVPYINYKYGKSGSLWEGRYKASLVQDDKYLLRVMKYIELNPVRACMVELPGEYRWSSFYHNSGVKQINFISEHELYLSLGRDEVARQNVYMETFQFDLSERDLDRIRTTWQTGTPLGNEFFREKIEKQLNLKVGQTRRGRPWKTDKGL